MGSKARIPPEFALKERSVGGGVGEGCTPGEINLPAVCRCGWSFSACLSLTPARAAVAPHPPRPLSLSLSLSRRTSSIYFFLRREDRRVHANSIPGLHAVHAGSLRLGPISRVVRYHPLGADAGVSTIGLHIHPTRCTGSAVAR